MSFSYNELAQKKTTYFVLLGGGLLLLLAAGTVWWMKGSVEPHRVFWGMLENSLSTAGVTANVQESNQGTEISQSLQYSIGADSQARALTTIKRDKTTVKTELIGDQKNTYNRYLDIVTNGKRDSAKAANVLNVWAKADSQSANLLSQAALGVGLPIGVQPIPIGNLTHNERELVLDQVRQTPVYTVDYGKVTKKRENGKLLYQYKVSVQPLVYLNMMKMFAKSVDMNNLDNIDANAYSGSKPVSVTVTVDARAQQLVAVQTEAGYKQTFSKYGQKPHVSMPKQALEASEINERLAKVQ